MKMIFKDRYEFDRPAVVNAQDAKENEITSEEERSEYLRTLNKYEKDFDDL